MMSGIFDGGSGKLRVLGYCINEFVALSGGNRYLQAFSTNTALHLALGAIHFATVEPKNESET